MVAYSFKARFAEPILAGTKQQTIRADRRRHARPGEELQLYTGMRTKQCRLIARATCHNVEPIFISFVGGGSVEVSGFPITNLYAFARGDGFDDWIALHDFWIEEHGHVTEWNGVLITWKPIAAVRLAKIA